MTAYLKLAVDEIDWSADFERALTSVLQDAGARYCRGNGKFRFVEHAPFNEVRPPIELSNLDREARSMQSLPKKLSLIEVENGFAQFHGETAGFSEEFTEYLKAYFAVVHEHFPGARTGYLFWWDGHCEDDPPVAVTEFPSLDDLLMSKPALRVISLARR